MSDQTDPKILARLKAALVRLPERQRAIFLALIAEDAASYAELAVRFEIDLAKVERDFAAALAALATALDR